MAFLQIQLFSSLLTREVSVNVLMPQNKNQMKTLYLLHGLGDNHSAWMRFSNIERYALPKGIAVIMPNADRSFYTDTSYHEAYFSFLTKELPEMMENLFKGISNKRESTFIAGLSMGGYGALKAAFTYPMNYKAVCSLSGALEPDLCEDTFLGKDDPLFSDIFGKDRLFTGSGHDVFSLLEQAKNTNALLPDLFLSCGKDDPLLPSSERFFKKAKDLGCHCSLTVEPGCHEWNFWDRQIQPFLNYIEKC